MQNRIEELHKELENHEGLDEILSYANCVKEMIVKNHYDKDKLIEIEEKYSVETNFLLNLENSLKIGFDKNYEDPGLQVLINLRDRLYLIAVYKVLKQEGIEIPKGFVSKSYPELIKLVCD